MIVEHCRFCEQRMLMPFLDLGKTALANRFLSPERVGELEPTYPLRLAMCMVCGLVQIDEEVPGEELFSSYLYFSGTSDLIHAHAAFLARHLAAAVPLRPGDLVVEIASNDGTVLKAFRPLGVRTLGVEPARNIAEHAREQGIDTLCDFFKLATAQEIRERHGPARLVLARHVLAHVSDLHGFVRGLAALTAEDGLIVVEVPHLLTLHDRLEFDTVYHEHLCYFSVEVLGRLFVRFGLELVDIQEVSLHGGSILAAVQRCGGPRRPTDRVSAILTREQQAGLGRLETWQRFAARVEQSRAALLGEIDRLRAAGRMLAGYGAPAKGMTLLAYCGLGAESIPYLVDRSAHKQGLLTPGHHIPIDSPQRLLRDRPDVVLLLAWNFAAEIVRQQAHYVAGGGRFLSPIPSAHYLN